MFHPSVASSSPQRAPFRALASLALLALLAGCAGGPTGHSAGQVEPRQPPLEAKASFFADTVQATAQVSGFGLPIPGRGDRPGHEEAPGGRPPGGRRGGLGHGPGGAGGPGGVGPGGPGGPRETSGAPSRPSLPRRGSEPRQTLRISFINTGTEPVEFTVAALRSAIGNFQPRPEHLTLAGGAAATLDPVSGDAGGALEWIDVTLSLRRTASTETRVLHLTRAAPPNHPFAVVSRRTFAPATVQRGPGLGPTAGLPVPVSGCALATARRQQQGALTDSVPGAGQEQAPAPSFPHALP